MKIVINDPKKVSIFATIFRRLKDVAPDVNIDLYTDKMYIQGMDDARVCLFELLLQSDWFEEFDVNKQDVLGIKCEIMFKMIGCLEDGQKIVMHMKDKADKLSVDFDALSGDKKSIKKSFEVPLMMIDSEHLEIPPVEYQSDIIIKSTQFSELISQLAIFGDEISVNCNMNTIDFASKGEYGQMTASIKDEDIVEYAIEEDANVDLTCGLKFVTQVCAFEKITNNIYLHFSNERPLKLHYSLDEKSSDESQNYVRFFIAPKISDI
jgi:proliferating cell nuclear antigen PCNA